MKQATDNDKGIQCKMCENWHYVVCECISDEAYSWQADLRRYIGFVEGEIVE